MEIEEDNLRSILRDEMYIKAKKLWVYFLKPQSENIISKLSNDFEPDVIEDVLEFLRKYNLLMMKT